MNKKYIKHLLREWMPIAIVAMALLVTPIFLASMTTGLYDVYRTESEAIKPTTSYGILFTYGILVIGAIVFSCLMPFFVESYRYSKKSTDCYYSLPFKEGELRRIRTIIALIMIIAIFSICYWLPAIIYYIRYCNVVLPEVESGYTIIKKTMVNPAWLTAVFFILIVLISIVFFVNSFFVRLSNGILSGVILLVAGNLFLSAFFPSLGLWSLLAQSILGSESNANLAICLQVYGCVYPIYMYYAYFLNLVGGNLDSAYRAISSVVLDLSNGTSFFMSLIVNIALGTISAVMVFKAKDPSGEYSKAPGSHSKYAIYILMASFITLGILNSISGVAFTGLGYLGIFSIATFLMSFVFYAVFQYLVYLLFLMKAKLSKKAWILAAIAQGITLLLYIVMFSISISQRGI